MATRVDISKAPYEPEKVPEIVDQGSDQKGDLQALGVFEDFYEVKDGVLTFKNDELQAAIDSMCGAAGQAMLLNGEFKAAKGSSVTYFSGGDFKFVTLVGMGKSEALSKPRRGPSPFQAAGAAVASACSSYKCKSASFSCIMPAEPAIAQDDIVQDVTYGAIASSTASGARFKSDQSTPPVTLETLALPLGSSGAAAAARGAALAAGTLYAKYLVDAPPNVCTPEYLAGAAAAIAEKFPDCMSLEVLEKAQCEEMGMGCYLGVAECSELPPKFIHLTYKPSGEVKKKVAIVGKGLTFDSGGYNLKPSGSMIELMKFDMGGSAATFGAARALAVLKPPGIEVHFISASCENMIDGRGMRPGDILTSANGKTVEIGNTDAEGRLTLCDALWFAQEKVGAELCVDIATLTGAQIVALGTGIGAVMAPEGAAAERVIAAGAGVGGEKWWELPLEDEYFEMMASKCADFNNIGGRFAGTITAGLFLKQFVDGEKMEWAHCDIAGPAFDFTAKRATGFGAATLANWAVGISEKSTAEQS